MECKTLLAGWPIPLVALNGLPNRSLHKDPHQFADSSQMVVIVFSLEKYHIHKSHLHF
jgi:hypothetical protein